MRGTTKRATAIGATALLGATIITPTAQAAKGDALDGQIVPTVIAANLETVTLRRIPIIGKGRPRQSAFNSCQEAIRNVHSN